MRYHIYCNQKSITHNHLLAIEEFGKRLSAYCEIYLHTDMSLQLPKEINHKSHQILLLQSGISTYSSDDFAKCINNMQLQGKSTIHVIIGYSEIQLYHALPKNSDYSNLTYLSLSNSTLTTQTSSLLFYEQLYRAYTILQGKTYHK